MLVHKINGYGVFRIVKGEPLFCEYKETRKEAEKELKIYNTAYEDEFTKVYPITMILEC